MTQLEARPASGAVLRRSRAGHQLLIVGGITFFASGPLHPQGTDDGDKTDQLHSMLVDPNWYPAHALALVAFACIAAGLLVIGRAPAVGRSLGRLLPIAQAIAVLGAAGSGVHLFAATQATAIEGGGTTPLIAVFMGIETLVNPAWGLMISVLAVRGGLSRALGNRLVLALGVVGGLAFALATATIAFVDTFDPLFPVAGLIGLWLVAVGSLGLTRHRG